MPRLSRHKHFPPMLPAEMQAIGKRIFHVTQWRGPMARALGLEPRHLLRMCPLHRKGLRTTLQPIPPTVAVALRILDAAWLQGPAVFGAIIARLEHTNGPAPPLKHEQQDG